MVLNVTTRREEFSVKIGSLGIRKACTKRAVSLKQMEDLGWNHIVAVGDHQVRTRSARRRIGKMVNGRVARAG